MAEKENVLIEAGECAVTLLPALGGKVASIRVKGRELLQAPLAPLAPRTRTMPFDAGDASGWDECLPSVGGCTVETAAGKAEVPDHGDLWRVAWEQVARDAGSVTLKAECFSLPLTLERKVAVTETGGGWRLEMQYKLTNRGKEAAPWSWAAHPLFTAAAGDRIVLPESIKTLRLEGSGGGRLGAQGDAVLWPVATLTDGSQTDLSVAEDAQSGIGDKLFTGALGAAENWCELVRPSVGLSIRFRFDPAVTPYLGLWICYGGWPERPGPKQVCVAIEPSTAPVDALSVTGPWSLKLLPGESYSWPMFIDLNVI